MTWEELITKISIHSIYERKTKYKDFKTKNIGLDFYGFDAVLPLKEISNNLSLSFSLFNTLKKGEIISLVLIDIDEANRKLTI
jgi:ribosomal protein S1